MKNEIKKAPIESVPEKFVEHAKEEVEQKEDAGRIVDLLMENYVDDKNNLREYKTVYCDSRVDSYPEKDILDKKIQEALKDELFFESMESITDVMIISGVEEEVWKRFFDKKQDLKKRILIAQILSDITYQWILDSESASEGDLEKLKKALQDENNQFFYKVYLGMLVKKCRDIHMDLNEWKYSEEELEKKEEALIDVLYGYHDKNLNELELKLTPLMKTRLNEGGGGGDVEYSDELHVMQEQSGVDEYSREMPYYSGNYVISKLSPEAYGIYSKSGILVGYFELEKVESAKNNRTEVEVKEPEKLFREINFENPDQDSFLFKLLLSVPFRDEIKKRLGLDIADLDIKNQYFFLRFIGEKTERDFKKVSEFVKDGKEQKDQLNRVKTFLSLEFGEDISEKLFAISEKLSPEQTDLVFAKYAEIVEMTYDIESEIMGSLKKKEKMGRIDPRMVSKELLLRGRKLLVSFADKIEKAEEGSLSLEEILSHLEDYREDMVFHAAVVKEGKKVGMGYDEFVGNKFEIVTAEELAKDPNVVKQMRDIYERNWAGTPALQASLLRNFDLAVEQGGDNTLFFVLKHVDLKLAQASVEAFCRTDEVSPDKIYFGSLNVRPSIQGAALGRIVKEAALAMEGEHYNLELDSDPFDPKTTTVYIEKDGFVATRAYEYEGEYTFSLAKERQGKDYFFKKMSQADVAEYHMQNNLGNAYNEDDSRMVLFLPIGENETRKLLDELVNKKHFVITRYFFSQDQKSVYCALERGVSSS